MTTVRPRWILVALCTVLATHPVRAQDAAAAGGPTVNSHGAAESKRLPTILRVYVEIPIKGKDLPEALERFKERREKLKKSIAGVGGEAAVFGDPTNGEKSARQKQMEMYMGQRYRGKPPAKAKFGAPIEITATVRFDLPLKADSVEDLILKSEKLREKVKDLDLAGLKDGARSPQEEEIDEEMAAMLEQNGGQPMAKPGEPAFLFIAKLAPADIEKNLAEACADARRRAQLLARAAGAELGDLVNLQGVGGSAGYGGYDPDGGAYSGRGGYYDPNANLPLHQLVAADEVSSSAPGQISHRSGITATFRLKTK